MRNCVHLLTYANRFGGSRLEDLQRLLDVPLKGIFGGMHILPFFYPAEGDHRQLRKVLKIKSSFPTQEAARKLLFLVTQDIAHQWTGPIFNWPLILNQLAIRYEDRLSFG